jgi:hypothetical protein
MAVVGNGNDGDGARFYVRGLYRARMGIVGMKSKASRPKASLFLCPGFHCAVPEEFKVLPNQVMAYVVNVLPLGADGANASSWKDCFRAFPSPQQSFHPSLP